MLVCLTASHKNADFNALEALATADAAALPSALAAHPGVDGAVVVSTCNRFELYLDVQGSDAEAPARAHAAASSVLSDHHPESMQHLVDGDAAEHLFAVAAGLESVIVGEGEIAGQVRRALRSAQTAGTTSPQLERLFQRASETQRGIKNRTGLNEAGRSLVRLGLDLASARVDWAKARVLIVGTGRYAAVSLAELRRRGASDIEVWGPSGRRSFARAHGIPAVDSREADLAVAGADVVVTCTSTERFVVDAALIHRGRERLSSTHAHPGASTPEHHGCPVMLHAVQPTDAKLCPISMAPELESACPVEHGRPAQVIVDLGLPRNVDPDVRGVHGIELLDLETISLHAPLEHLTASDDARAIVQKAALRFERGTEERRVAPAIQAFRNHVEQALEAELQRVNKRGTEAERRAAEQALRHFAGVLLHKPTVRARELAADGRHDDFLAAVDALFGIEGAA